MRRAEMREHGRARSVCLQALEGARVLSPRWMTALGVFVGWAGRLCQWDGAHPRW
jgi:hypothetical protein